MNGKRILVAGAGSALGVEIIRLLRAGGADITATFRTQRPGIKETLLSLGAKAERLDLVDAEQARHLLRDVCAAIFTPILTVSGAAAKLLRNDQRAVFFSSNNVAIDPGADIYRRLLSAEVDIHAAAPHSIILRPTMIYGYPGDGNFSRLIKAMRRFPVTPLPGAGNALQQPVHYKALARTAVAALKGTTEHPRLCAVAGPEPVSLRQLFKITARAAKARTLIAPLPIQAFAPVFRLIEQTGLNLPVSAAQLARAGLDKTPKAEHVILTDIGPVEGLAALAAALDAGLDEAPTGA